MEGGALAGLEMPRLAAGGLEHSETWWRMLGLSANGMEVPQMWKKGHRQSGAFLLAAAPPPAGDEGPPLLGVARAACCAETWIGIMAILLFFSEKGVATGTLGAASAPALGVLCIACGLSAN